MSESWLSNGAYFSMRFFFKPRKPILVCLLDNILCLDKMFSSFWEPRTLVPPHLVISLSVTVVLMTLALNLLSKTLVSALPIWWIQSLWLGKWSWKYEALQPGEPLGGPQDRVLRNCDGKLLKEEFYMLTSNIYTETFKIISLQNFVVCRLFRNKRIIQKRRESCLHSLYPKVSDISIFYLNFLSMYISFIYLLFLLLYFKLQ